MPAASRLMRFLEKPFHLKVQALRYHFKTRVWNRLLPRLAIPVRLPWGGWWLARDDVMGDAVFAGLVPGVVKYYLEQVLRPGKSAVDIGAHHGFYTLLMSRLVGPQGCVAAFEPSPREWERLSFHLRMNRCTNARAEQLAVADAEGTMEFFVVHGRWTVGNSLRAPRGHDAQRLVVQATTLDSYFLQSGVPAPDLIKIDAEGAELEILRGASRVLSWLPRPVIVCEIHDDVLAEGGWPHSGREVLDFLRARDYRWYEKAENGGIKPLVERERYIGDYLAVPVGREAEFGLSSTVTPKSFT